MQTKPTRSGAYEPHRTRFAYDLRHPTEADRADFVAMRQRAVALADEIGARTRVCAAQSLALRKLREVIHAAEEAVLGDYSRKRQVDRVDPDSTAIYGQTATLAG